jgi:hypothetical protein
MKSFKVTIYIVSRFDDVDEYDIKESIRLAIHNDKDIPENDIKSLEVEETENDHDNTE